MVTSATAAATKRWQARGAGAQVTGDLCAGATSATAAATERWQARGAGAQVAGD